MARSGSFSIETQNKQYIDGYVEWTQSNLDSKNCTSKLNLKAYLHRKNNVSSSINNRSITRKFFVAGEEYGVTENITITLPGTQEYVLFYERNVTISHEADGSKNNLEIGFQSIYSGSAATSFTVPKTTATIDLDKIPRYAILSHNIKSKTETSLVVSWNSDSLISQAWYRVNKSTWIDLGAINAKTGSYVINNLNANQEYIIETCVRRSDSQLDSYSNELKVRTYDIPYATATPNFTVGNTLTIPIYNPLGRKVKVYLVPNGGIDLGGDVIAGTSISGYVSDTFKNGLYQASPNSPTNTYKVKTICDEINSTWTTSGSGTYTIPNTPPDFNTFEYLDCDSNIVAITGSNQYIVKNKSNLRVAISSLNKMIAKKYATPQRYEISCANRTKSLDYSDSNTYIDLGTINSSGLMNVVVKAYDSRGFYTQKSISIEVIDYIDPIQENTLARVNNYENQTELKIKGSFSLVSCDGVAKNTITRVRYRYKKNENGAAYVSYTEVVPAVNGNRYECELRTLDLDNRYSYVFEISVTDAFETEKISEILLDEGKFIMFVNSSKRNLGIGCINEHEEGSVQAEDYYLNDNSKSLKEILNNPIKFKDINNLSLKAGATYALDLPEKLICVEAFLQSNGSRYSGSNYLVRDSSYTYFRNTSIKNGDFDGVYMRIDNKDNVQISTYCHCGADVTAFRIWYFDF